MRDARGMGKIAGITATIRGSRRGNARGPQGGQTHGFYGLFIMKFTLKHLELFLYDKLIPFLPYFYSCYAAGQNHAAA